MGRIKSWLRTMPLRRAFASLVLVMALLVVCVSSITIYACMTVQERILSSVTYIEGKNIEPEPEEDTYTIVITDEGKVTPGENGMLVMLSKEYRLQNLTWQKRILYYGAKVATIVLPALMFASGTIICARFFYSVKIDQPLTLLLQSADRIAQNDLNFILEYPARDEMGELCRAMNTMRGDLLISQRETLALMEERRNLNASIAHDLRTPITVMKGYTEYLSHNIPLGRIPESALLETISKIEQATGRLEKYVNQMRDVQALDAIPVRPEICPLRTFFMEQEDVYDTLAEQNNLGFLMEIKDLPNICVTLDMTLTHRLIDNVISNALRFAQHEIRLEASWICNELAICISDDGPGFSDEALRSAATPFYKENSENDHFGLGLSICDTLCRKMGGSMILSNQPAGGASVEITIKAESIQERE